MAIKNYENKGAAFTIKVDEDKCIGAGECVSVCPTNVYDLIEGKTHANRVEDCIECCACVDACPTKAIVHTSCVPCIKPES